MTDCPHDDRPDLCPMCEIGRLRAFKEAADGLADALERISLMSCRCIDDGKPCTGCTKSGREAPAVAYQALAKYRGAVPKPLDR